MRRALAISAMLLATAFGAPPVEAQARVCKVFGVRIPCGTSPGVIQQVQGAHVSGQANWTGWCDSNSYRDTALYNPPPGWVVLDSRLVVTNNNNGSATMSVVAAGLNFASEKVINEAYRAEMKAAASDGKRKLSARLNEARKRHLQELISVKTNRNTVSVSGSASSHGSCVDRKGGSIDAYALMTIKYIGENSVDRVRREIRDRFSL